MKLPMLFIVLCLAFLGGDDVLALLGYYHRDFTTSAIFRLHPLTYLAFALLLYYFVVRKLWITDIVGVMKHEFLFLLVCLAIIIYLQLTGKLSAISFILDTLCLPAVLSILFKLTDRKVLDRSVIFIYGCFFLNAAMAIVEKVRGATLLNKEDFNFDYFRSTALYAHPLNNALIMSVLTVMLFFASNTLGKKMLVISFGLASIFCFGARGAILGVFAGILINVALSFFATTNAAKKASGIFYLLFISVVSFIIISYTGLGDRIVGMSRVEGSAEARITAFDVLHGFSLKDLLWGYGTAEIEYFQYISNVEIIENFWINWVLRFGFVGTVVLALFLVRFLWTMMRGSSLDIRITMLFVMFTVASTNNSLSTNSLILSLFVATYYVIYKSPAINTAGLH
jgi:hypothetical protein